MPLLGGAFPEAERRAYAVRQLTAGRVLHLTCDFTKPPKPKFVVLAAAEEPPLLLVVNSRIAAFIEARPYLKDVQVTIDAGQHAFLERDSFINCGEAVDSMSLEDIIKQIVDDPSCVRGELSVTVRAEVVRAVRRARTVSAIHKRRICAVLE